MKAFSLFILLIFCGFASAQTAPDAEPKKTNAMQLTKQSIGVGGLMIMGMGALWAAPEDFSQWYDKPEATPRGFYNRWKQNVTDGPVWDGDIRLFNAYSHIHAGAAYSVMCLDSHFSQTSCMVYANAMSIIWEYGPEAVTEIPSWQDILMTGLVGGRVGLLFHKWKKQIQANGDRIWRSKIIGKTAKFLLDPFGHMTRGFRDTKSTDGTQPFVNMAENKNMAFGVQFSATF